MKYKTMLSVFLFVLLSFFSVAEPLPIIDVRIYTPVLHAAIVKKAATVVGTNVSGGKIVGKPMVFATVSIAWDVNTNATGYNVYAGTNQMDMGIINSFTNLIPTNGMVGVSITNVPTWCIDYVAVTSFGSFGSWDESSESEIAFVAPGYLVDSLTGYFSTNGTGTNTATNFTPTNIVVNFTCSSNHTYIVQSRPMSGTNWSNRKTFSGTNCFAIFNDPISAISSNCFYRLAIQ